MTRRPLTAAQTVGPFFHPTMLRDDVPQHTLAAPGTVGQRVRVEGRVLDGAGAPAPDAVIELWQANSHGRYNHPADTRDLPLDPAFLGFARAGTDDEGRYWFDTVRPGRVPFPDGRLQAPHLCLTVFARGLLHHLLTRVYFDDDAANADDPILLLVPSKRRATLIARSEGSATVFQHDIILQGDSETVFLNPVAT
ncbi:MAG TPA: protocatechuate 3,4-dioxygenase subunit alpha [Thermomicrobiales bacterium]|nr:protocatechuate 3,4-dioxygenase subunit alpha [Thermomicrobiales bacterium]